MHNLNKNQLILLVLLVSFVTSIATGIITTSLLQQAPPSVTQVINRVVQQTIEKVTPADNTKPAATKEVTVVVNEEDQVISAISKNVKSIVRIKDDALVNGVQTFYGIGLLLSSDGLIVSANRDILNPDSTYTATFSDGTTFPMKVAGVDSVNNLVFFRVALDPKLTVPADPATLTSADPQLGQSVIALDGQDKNSVAIGRISSLAQSDTKIVNSIETDITVKAQVLGAPIINLSGDIMGIRTSLTDSPQTFVPASIINNGMTKYAQTSN